MNGSALPYAPAAYNSRPRRESGSAAGNEQVPDQTGAGETSRKLPKPPLALRRRAHSANRAERGAKDNSNSKSSKDKEKDKKKPKKKDKGKDTVKEEVQKQPQRRGRGFRGHVKANSTSTAASIASGSSDLAGRSSNEATGARTFASSFSFLPRHRHTASDKNKSSSTNKPATPPPTLPDTAPWDESFSITTATTTQWPSHHESYQQDPTTSPSNRQVPSQSRSPSVPQTQQPPSHPYRGLETHQQDDGGYRRLFDFAKPSVQVQSPSHQNHQQQNQRRRRRHHRHHQEALEPLNIAAGTADSHSAHLALSPVAAVSSPETPNQTTAALQKLTQIRGSAAPSSPVVDTQSPQQQRFEERNIDDYFSNTPCSPLGHASDGDQQYYSQSSESGVSHPFNNNNNDHRQSQDSDGSGPYEFFHRVITNRDRGRSGGGNTTGSSNVRTSTSRPPSTHWKSFGRRRSRSTSRTTILRKRGDRDLAASSRIHSSTRTTSQSALTSTATSTPTLTLLPTAAKSPYCASTAARPATAVASTFVGTSNNNSSDWAWDWDQDGTQEGQNPEHVDDSNINSTPSQKADDETTQHRWDDPLAPMSSAPFSQQSPPVSREHLKNDTRPAGATTTTTSSTTNASSKKRNHHHHNSPTATTNTAEENKTNLNAAISPATGPSSPPLSPSATSLPPQSPLSGGSNTLASPASPTSPSSPLGSPGFFGYGTSTKLTAANISVTAITEHVIAASANLQAAHGAAARGRSNSNRLNKPPSAANNNNNNMASPYRTKNTASHPSIDGASATSGGGASGSMPATTFASTSSGATSAASRQMTVRGGRPYLSDTSLCYCLPLDLAELHRQSLRTLLQIQVFGSPVNSSVFATRPPTKVLELFCGTGFWSMMCHRYYASKGHGNIQFTGVDITNISPSATQMNPPDGGGGGGSKPDTEMNWRFIQHDLRQTPWPFEEEEFDLIMVKDASLAMPTAAWYVGMDEFLRCLKPGGVVEIWESDHQIRMLRPHDPNMTSRGGAASAVVSPGIAQKQKQAKGQRDNQSIAQRMAGSSSGMTTTDDSDGGGGHSGSESESSEDEVDAAASVGAYVMTANTPLSAPLNSYLVEYNSWLSRALAARELSPVPCTIIGPILVQEPALKDARSRRLAIPLAEVRWEREGVGGVVTKDGKTYVETGRKRDPSQATTSSSGASTVSEERRRRHRNAAESGTGRVKKLTNGQAAVRRTAMLTFVQFVQSLEPVLREASGKSQDEMDAWIGKMMNDLMRDNGAACGECIELGAWWATKREGH